MIIDDSFEYPISKMATQVGNNNENDGNLLNNKKKMKIELENAEKIISKVE